MVDEGGVGQDVGANAEHSNGNTEVNGSDTLFVGSLESGKGSMLNLLVGNGFGHDVNETLTQDRCGYGGENVDGGEWAKEQNEGDPEGRQNVGTE